jgi:hypothetical protein
MVTARPLLDRLKRPLSEASTRPVPLVSYHTDRLLSGWIRAPLVIRAFGAHTFRCKI